MAIRWMAGAALLLAVGVTHAGDIYTCKGPGGVNVYQNTPCPTPQAELKHSQYDAAMARAPAPPPVAYAGSQAMPGQVNAAPPREVQQPVQQQGDATAGYRCTAGRKSWIQFAPCPSTYNAPALVDVDGFTTTGQHVTGTGWVHQQAPVRQTTMDRDTLCAQVAAGANVGGRTDGDKAYERNKVRRNLCGG